MKTQVFICLLWLGFCPLLKASPADSLALRGNLQNSAAKTIGLYSFANGKMKVEKLISPQKGQFSINIAKEHPTGILRLLYDAHAYKYIDIIWNGKENIAFEMDIAADALPKIIESAENKAYYAFLVKYQEQIKKVSWLTQFEYNYPNKQSPTYQAALAENPTEKAVLKALVQNAQTPHTWAAKMIKNQRSSLLLNSSDFWKDINIKDDSLWQTPYYQDIIMGYLRMEVQKANSNNYGSVLNTAIDVLMNKFATEQGHKNAIALLTETFKNEANDNALYYLDSHYASAEQCDSDLEATEREARMKAYMQLREGTPAPEITFINPEDKKPFGLKDIVDEKILLVFWSSGCSHCQATMPQISADAPKYKDLGVIAISLDTDSTAYQNAIKKLPNLFHYTDFKRSQSKPVKDYKIVNTPTFFLLDKQRRIIGRYHSYEDVKEEL